MKQKNPKQKVSPWDKFLQKISHAPIYEEKDRELVRAARDKALELKLTGYTLTTEI